MFKNFNQDFKKIVGFIKRNYRQILMGLIILLGTVYLILAFLAPKKKINQVNEEFSDSLKAYQLKKEYPYSENPDLFKLYKEKAFILSRIAMAGSGTTGLVVELQDSILNLEINGVKIHTTHISKIRVSRIFGALDPSACLALLSQPFTIHRNHSTIAKEPIIVKQAPKDTIEAAKLALIPDTLIFGPAFISMKLDYNIRLSVYQDKTGSFREGVRKFFFISGIRFSQAGDNIWNMMTFRIPDYKLEIRICIPQDDLVSVYRALPENAKVVVRI